MRITEKNFIILLRDKNEKALDYVIDNYGWVVKAIVQKQLYNMKSVQEDCINDIFMAIWSNIDKFDETRSGFKNWIIGISKFKSIDLKRKFLRELAYESIDDLELSTPDNTISEIIKDELDFEIERLLNCLKEDDKELFIKLYVKEIDIVDIVKDMGLKRENIYNRVSKGKKKIKRLQDIVSNRG